jgi:hypothetical protein
MWWRKSIDAQISIPEKPPQQWTGTKRKWKALRAHCVALFSEIASTGNVKPLPHFSSSDWEHCHEIAMLPNQASSYPLGNDTRLRGN